MDYYSRYLGLVLRQRTSKQALRGILLSLLLKSLRHCI